VDAKYDEGIAKIEPTFRENREGDIPHSQASIEKAKRILGYKPEYDAISGFGEACGWY
jgi:UDP-N-acetylglucosamine/UDP-N-acetylgalactosamine 4-epimerase